MIECYLSVQQHVVLRRICAFYLSIYSGDSVNENSSTA